MSDRDLQNRLSDGLNSAIGAQTRLFFVEITDISRIESGDVAAYSEALGNIKVYTGENRWLTVGDRVYVTRIAASNKYDGYYFVGWMANASNRNPGSILAFDSTDVGTIASLPAAAVARQNQIRLVGGIPYHYTDADGWTPFGSRPRQYVWFLGGELQAGAAGAVIQLDHVSTLTEVILHASTPPTGTLMIDIQTSSNLSSWSSIFAARPTIATGASSGGGGVLSVPGTSYAAGTWLRCYVVDAAVSGDVTVQLRLTT